jgi:1-acyl-sn-glycerol-3-phosphate acyltransferase
MNVPPPKPVTEIWRPDLVRLPKLTPARRAFRIFAQGLLKLIAKICLNVSSEGMENIPQHGPLLIVINHLGDADAPSIMSSLPFSPDALAEIELFELPILGELMDWYGVIWLHRGRADTRAIRAALDGLAEGRIIIIAPEGRYSLTGALEEGTGGAAFLAYKSGAMVLPIAVTGTENENVYGQMKRLRRARINVKVGKMFKLVEPVKGAALSGSKNRQEAVDLGTRQIMQALAGLLPEKYQGAYSRS